MSYALIDNASLTAAQRVLGHVVVKNPDTVNGDLVAFENLLHAILFYDDLICIDNYKEQHKEERAKEFHYVRFLSPQEFGLQEFESKAMTIHAERRNAGTPDFPRRSPGGPEAFGYDRGSTSRMKASCNVGAARWPPGKAPARGPTVMP